MNIPLKINLNSNRTRILLFFGAVVAIAFFQWQSYYYYPRAGLDPSWQASLGMVNASDNLFYGKDYAFTYGPAYFLMSGFMMSSSMILNLVGIFGLNLLFATLRVGLMFKIAFGVKAETKATKFAKISALFLLFTAAKPFVICDYIATLVFFWLYDSLLLLRDKQFAKVHIFTKVVPAAVLLSIMPMVKFSYVAIAIFGMLVIIGVMLFYKRFVSALASLLTFGIATCGFWVLLGQKLEYLGLFFKYGLEQASGYSEAMAFGLENTKHMLQFFPNLLFGIIFCALCAVGLFWALRNNKLKAFALFVGVSLLFLTWKESFVRADGHTLLFYNGAVFAIAYIVYVFGKEKFEAKIAFPKKFQYLPNICLVVFLAAQMFVNGIYFCSYNQLLNDAKNVYKSAKEYQENIEELRTSYEWFEPLATNIENGDTVDVLPWDISLLYAYSLNYNPRLSVQSYSDYTEELDTGTANGFSSTNAPDKLIYDFTTIDGRYPIFDEPQTFRTILNNYSVIAGDKENALILNHTVDVTLQENVISSTTAKLGENIAVPKSDDGYIYMRIDEDITLLGKLANFIYKMPHDYITITTTDGTEHKFTFIRRVAVNGLYVTSYVEDLVDFENVLNGKATANIESIRINGSSLFYDKEFEVTFFTTPNGK